MSSAGKKSIRLLELSPMDILQNTVTILHNLVHIININIPIPEPSKTVCPYSST
jgi:hypothetical protein